MLLAQNQQPVETLRPNRAHEALRHAVGLGRPKWRPDDLNVFSPKHVVKALGELLITIPDQESEGRRAIGQCPGQLPGLLRDPRRGR